MNGIIRVFPCKTSYTPCDDYVFIGLPPFKELIPEHNEIHISCTFTWDKNECLNLKYQWETVTNMPVKLGGGCISFRSYRLYSRNVPKT